MIRLFGCIVINASHTNVCLALNLLECWFNSILLIRFASVQFSSWWKYRSVVYLLPFVVVFAFIHWHSQPALNSCSSLLSLFILFICLSQFLAFGLAQQMTGIFLNGACKINKGTLKNNSCNCNIPTTPEQTLHTNAHRVLLKALACPFALRAVWQRKIKSNG